MTALIPITWAGAPRWWASGRERPAQYVVVHDTEGHAGPDDAESGVAYDKRRDDSVSCHIMVDTNTALREVADADTAYAAFPKGNTLGIQVELCHAGVWDLSKPNDAATFDNGAQVVAQLCKEHGFPATHLTVPQVRAAWYGPTKPKGVCGHWDVTRAYPEDGGDHTDPGTTFPWAEFIRRVAGYMTGTPALQPPKESDMFVIKDSTGTAFVGDGINRRVLDPAHAGTAAFVAANPTNFAKASGPVLVDDPDAFGVLGVPVAVDASAVADAVVAALTTNTAFLAALAKAVNDDDSARMAN